MKKINKGVFALLSISASSIIASGAIIGVKTALTNNVQPELNNEVENIIDEQDINDNNLMEKESLWTWPIAKPKFTLIDVDEIYPDVWLSLNQQELRKIIFKNISKIFANTEKIPSFSIEDIEIESNSIQAVNALGNIQLIVGLRRYYDSNNNLIDTTTMPGQELLKSELITIKGFKNKILTNVFFSARDFGWVETSINVALQAINRQWIFNYRNILFNNSDQILTSVDDIVSVKPVIISEGYQQKIRVTLRILNVAISDKPILLEFDIINFSYILDENVDIPEVKSNDWILWLVLGIIVTIGLSSSAVSITIILRFW